MPELITIDKLATMARELPVFARKQALLSVISRGTRSSLQMASHMVNDLKSNITIARANGNGGAGSAEMQQQLVELSSQIDSLIIDK